MEISKELFENIMGIKLGNAHNTEQELLVTDEVAMFTDIKKTYKLGYPIDTISIYELADKSKKWANNKGFRIIEIDTDLFWVIPKKYNISSIFDYGMISSKHNTFFKACQWILEECIKKGSD